MRNTWIAKAGAAALVIGLAGVASAQSNGPTGLSARLGIFLPTSNNHVPSGAWFAGGIDYKLNSLSSMVPVAGSYGYFGVSADYYNNGGTSNIPVVLTYNYRQQQLVWFAGAGVEFYNIPFNATSSGTGFNAQLGVSYDLSKGSLPVFLQAKYFFSSQSNLSGFGVYAGLRF